MAPGHAVGVRTTRGDRGRGGIGGALGPRARAATAAEAAAAGDLVVVSVPFKAFRDVPVAELAGKVVLNTNNYYAQRDGQFAELDEGKRTSSELEQEHLGTARLVKVFNNIYSAHLGALARPAGAADRTALTIAGDDSEAKQAATAFLDAIGFDTVDVGTLADSWRVEPGQPAYGPPYGSVEDPAGTPASVEKVRAAVAAAKP
ncbi:NAD(P)-binding domain-containing protein [Actinoplanes sp. NPDC051633]|uniref:NADPH-dependent F420 reductase n=1 Tax=Actinoplanes sp. NPDC051633 TaxID=3155670 RepID=UPI0034133AB6